jgi:hypothetical protein
MVKKILILLQYTIKNKIQLSFEEKDVINYILDFYNLNIIFILLVIIKF